MKGIVIYKSKTGFAKRYAEWIAEELKWDISNYKNFLKYSIEEYDFVIYGSRVHAGKVDGLKKIKELFTDKTRTKLVVFATGATPSAAKDVINTIWNTNFSEKEFKTIPHFYMQGGLNYEKMGFADRLIMKTVAKMMSRKSNKSPEEVGFQQAIVSSYDISSREYIEPLVKYVQLQVQGKM